MEKKIELTSEFPILHAWWIWDDEEVINDIQEKYGRIIEDDEWEEIIEEETNKFGAFLSHLSVKYNNKFRIDPSDPDETSVIFPDKFNSLKGYVDMILEVINYLEANSIPWSINDLAFNFSNTRASGIIRFDHDKKVVKIYYIEPKYSDLFRKKTIPFGKSKKMI